MSNPQREEPSPSAQQRNMHAVRLHSFGDPSVLAYESAPLPSLQPGEVLVRVHAASINPPDLMVRDGYRSFPPEWQPDPAGLPFTPGSDVSGVVVELKDQTPTAPFKVGDEVHGMIRFPTSVLTGSGAYAEYIRCSPAELALIPAGVDHLQAAAATMSLLTAWQFLVEVGHAEPNPFQAFPHAPIELRGKSVLINGAGGGVGHLLVQLAKWKGARVIAVASSKHEALMHQLGADQFVDYTKSPLDEALGAGSVDLVVDAVGGENQERFLPLVKDGGALYLVNPIGFQGHDAAKQRGVTVSSTQVRSNGPQLAEASRLVADGTVKIVLDSTFPLADAAKAHERAGGRGVQGKIVLLVS